MENSNKNSFFTVLKNSIQNIRDAIFVFTFFLIFLHSKLSTAILFASLDLIVSVIYSIFKWMYNTFYVNENILYYNTGVFFKKQMKIPCENIATIDTEQTFFQKIFKVKTIKIDTNSSGNDEELRLVLSDKNINEFKNSLTKYDTSSNDVSCINDNTSTDNSNNNIADENIIYSMDKNKLLKFASLKGSKVLMITIILYILKQINNKDMLNDNNINYISNTIKKSPLLFILILLAPIFILVLLKLISIIYYYAKFYDFKVIQNSNNLKISFGSFTKKSYNINLNNVHSVKINQNLGQQLLKTATINVSSFGYGDEDKEEAILIPHIHEYEINDLLEILFEKFIYNGEKFRISKNCKLRYKNARIGYNKNVLYLSGGILRKKINIITIECIDDITYKQYFFQRKRNLLKIVVNYKAMKTSDLNVVKGLNKKHFKDLERFLFLNE